jgi:hypothetical protein
VPKSDWRATDIITACSENKLVKGSNDKNAHIIKVVLHE